jgi:hypothetical protein
MKDYDDVVMERARYTPPYTVVLMDVIGATSKVLLQTRVLEEAMDCATSIVHTLSESVYPSHYLIKVTNSSHTFPIFTHTILIEEEDDEGGWIKL